MNHLFTLSYFRKRLRDAGLRSRILIDNYPQTDPRRWTIAIDPAHSIICTCFKHEQTCYFKFYEDDNLLKFNQTIKTDSMNVIITFLEETIAKEKKVVPV